MEVALWSILAAPMFISADLTKTSQDSKNLLLNTFGTNISQDQLAMMGFQKLILQSVSKYVIYICLISYNYVDHIISQIYEKLYFTCETYLKYLTGISHMT